MLKKIRKYVKQWHMIEEGDKIIVGVSGGADSICLLFVLMQLQKDIPFEIIVVHIHHGLRGCDADADAAYVEALCGKNHIQCVTYYENVELIAKKRKQSLEEAGRDVRREAFRKTLKQYNGTKIALAHHENDNAETFLMNLARGSGLKGLGGMLPVNGDVIRPLLTVERIEIENFLQENGIMFCIDQTNKSDDYTRNRVRNHIVPYLEQNINQKAVSHINEAMEQLREIREFVEQQAEVAWEQCVKKCEEGYIVLEKEFANIPQVIKSFVLKQTLGMISGKEKDIESVHLQMLQNLFEKQVGRKIDLPYEVESVRSYEGIVFRKKKKVYLKEKQEVVLELGKECTCKWCGRKVRSRVFDVDHTTLDYSEKSYTKWFDYDIIKDTVSVRMRKPGDYITIHKDGKKQKLKSYFINEKIPQDRREEIPLIVEGNHVLWIVGYRVNRAYRVTENTKQILEIQIDEGEDYGREN